MSKLITDAVLASREKRLFGTDRIFRLSKGASYNLGDVVIYNENYYKCIKAGTNAEAIPNATIFKKIEVGGGISVEELKKKLT